MLKALLPKIIIPIPLICKDLCILHCIPLSLSDIAYMSGYGRIDKLPTEINAGWFQLEASYAAYSPAQPSQIISNGRFLVKLGTLSPFYNSGASVNQHRPFAFSNTIGWKGNHLLEIFFPNK